MTQLHAYLLRLYLVIAAAIIGSLTVAMGLMVAGSHAIFKRDMVPEVELKTVAMGRTAADLLVPVMLGPDVAGQSRALELVLRGLVARDADLTYAAISDARGQIVQASGIPPEGFHSTLKLAGANRSASTYRLLRLPASKVVVVPISRPGEWVGELHLAMRSELIEGAALPATIDLAVVFVTCLVLAIEILTYMAGARFSTGLRALADTVGRIKAGDLRTSPEARSADEVGRLLRRVDSMVDTLNSRYHQVKVELENRRKSAAGDQDTLAKIDIALAECERRWAFGKRINDADSEEHNLNRVRGPLFAFILAESMARAYLPSYAAMLGGDPMLGAPFFVVASPILVAMLILAIGQPYLKSFNMDRGRRLLMAAGLGLGTCAFVGSIFAVSPTDLTGWRVLTAIGMALAFIGGRGYVVGHLQRGQLRSDEPSMSSSSTLVRSMLFFVLVMAIAIVCGPLLGAMIADSFGPRIAMAVSAVLGLASYGAVTRISPRRSVSHIEAGVPYDRWSLSIAQVRSMLACRTLTSTLFFAVAPSKMLLSGMCFLLIPYMILRRLEDSLMMTGLLMGYAVVMMLVLPLASRWTWRLNRVAGMTLALAISGAAALVIARVESVTGTIVGILLVWLASAVHFSTYRNLVEDTCREVINRHGYIPVRKLYDGIERGATLIGVMITCAMILAIGQTAGFIVMAALALGAACTYAIASQLWACEEVA